MFNEENTVEQMVLDTLCGGVTSNMVAEELASYGGEIKGWRFVAADELPRQHSDVLVESMVRDALIRLNPEIKLQPDRADEVLYRLRTIPLSVQSEGLVRANELFAEWLRGEKSMPFGERGEHTPVRLIDFENLSNNDYVVTNQWVYPVKEGGRRFDIIMLVNGIPLVVGEAKTPVRPAVTWVDGASDIHNGYEQSVPQMFVPNVLFCHRGKCYRYGSVRMPSISGGRGTGARQGRGDAGGRAALHPFHAAPSCGAGHPAELHPVRHRQETPPHQDHLPLSAVRRR